MRYMFKIGKILLALLLLFSCVSGGSGTGSGIASQSSGDEALTDIEKLNEISDLMNNEKFDEAEEYILNEIYQLTEEDFRISPFLENRTLMIYSQADSAVELSILLFFQPDSDNEIIPAEILLDRNLYPDLLQIVENREYDTVILIEPYVPRLYFHLAYINIEKGDLQAGYEYLMEALTIWPDFTVAYAEMMYVFTLAEDFVTAKKYGARGAVGLSAVDGIGQAAILRKLGYIAIEENELQYAEELYLKSLELHPDHPTALQELEYIHFMMEDSGTE